jgi:hypothetical protein
MVALSVAGNSTLQAASSGLIQAYNGGALGMSFGAAGFLLPYMVGESRHPFTRT